MSKRSGLGKNLTALLGDTNASLLSEESKKSSALTLSVNCLQAGKYQPRADIEQAPLTELADSIKQQGILQPLIVRELDNGRYEIIAGERRWRAAQLAGLTEVPVILKTVDDETAMAMALVENLQREDLNVMDQAKAMDRLITEFSLTHQKIAGLLGKSRTAVSNFLRLLTLSPDVRRLLEHGDIDMGHARTLLALEESQQFEVAQVIIAKQLSVREAEKLVKRVKEGKRNASEEKIPLQPFIAQQVQAAAEHLETKVQVKPKKNGQGSLVIHYKDSAKLEKLLTYFSPTDR